MAFSVLSNLNLNASRRSSSFTPLLCPYSNSNAFPNFLALKSLLRCSLSSESDCSSSKILRGKEFLIKVGNSPKFTPEHFQKWVELRLGTNLIDSHLSTTHSHPVYWYAIGDVFEPATGSRILTIEGVDVGYGIALNSTTVQQLSRKIFVFRDIITNQIVTEFNGKPLLPLKYEYQFVTYSLQDDGTLVAETTYGKDENVVTIIGDRFYIRDFTPNALFICSPLITERGWNESYDFSIINSSHSSTDAAGSGNTSSYYVSWHGWGPSKITDSGNVVMEMSGKRYDSIEEIGELSDFVKQNYPQWTFPPKDYDEIRSLQSLSTDSVDSTF